MIREGADEERQCEECQLEFRKHHLLRTHIAEVHSTPGTKPFPCTHDGCSQSFRYPYELKAHLKTHDSRSLPLSLAPSSLTRSRTASRYQCIHPACASLPLVDRQHATWSALQKHTKTAHPPTCPHAECEGKTFTTPRGLKWHLEVHERNEGDELPACRKRGRGKGRKKRKVDSDDALETESDWEQMESEREGRLDDSFSRGQGKRRKHDVALVDDDDSSAPFACGADQCDRRFKSVRARSFWPFHSLLIRRLLIQAGALETHTTLRHLSAPIVARPRRSSAPKSPAPAPQPAPTPLVDLLTGTNYASTRRFACPYPSILDISQPLDDEDLSDAEAPRGPEGERCEYRFGKVYDVERHLRSWHRVEVHREELREWLEGEQ